MRRVRQSLYGCIESNGSVSGIGGGDAVGADPNYMWQNLVVDDAILDLEQRYSGDGDSYFGITEMLFATFYAGLTTIISANGEIMPGIGTQADPAAYAALNQPGSTGSGGQDS